MVFFIIFVSPLFNYSNTFSTLNVAPNPIQNHTSAHIQNHTHIFQKHVRNEKLISIRSKHTECAELIGNLQYMSHQEFRKKGKLLFGVQKEGILNFSLNQNRSSGYDYSHSRVKYVKFIWKPQQDLYIYNIYSIYIAFFSLFLRSWYFCWKCFI